MRATTAIAAMLLLASTQPASSEVLYRCQDGKEITYSDRQCLRGVEKRVAIDAGPPAAVVASSSAQLRQRIEERASRVASTRDPNRVASTSSANPENATAACDTQGEIAQGEKTTFVLSRR
jgi:hypothetical protein